MPELLLELLSEEIPARMQKRAADDLKRLVCEGLKKAGSKSLPYTGDFTGDSTGKEHKLLIASDVHALRLNKHNLNNQSFSIWACPLAIYDSFDIYSGDIVFVAFAT